MNLVAINWSQLSATGIAQLDTLPQLNYLIVTGENPDPNIWNALTALKKLKTLDLQGMVLTVERAQSLRTMPNLTTLGLTFARSDAVESVLPTVSELTKLEHLILLKTGVSDAALSHVARLTNLKILVLQNTRVTNTGLERLAALKNLTRLELQGTMVTAAGVATLQKALPNCKIEWDGATSAGAAPPTASVTP